MLPSDDQVEDLSTMGVPERFHDDSEDVDTGGIWKDCVPVRPSLIHLPILFLDSPIVSLLKRICMETVIPSTDLRNMHSDKKSMKMLARED